MKDPTRLIDLPDEPARDLLRAAALEEPPEGALERLLGALPGAPTPPAAESHLSGVRPALRAAASVSRWPWIAGGALSLAAASWIAVRTLSPVGSSRPEPPPMAASPAPLLRAPAAAPPRSAEPAKPPAQPGALAAPAPKTAPESGARTRSLAQEIASLDHVRKLLGAGDAAQALRALRRHARGYPQGALQQEAELLQIEALTRAGEPAQARARAVQFLAQHPDSPHGPRVRSLLAGADGAP